MANITPASYTSTSIWQAWNQYQTTTATGATTLLVHDGTWRNWIKIGTNSSVSSVSTNWTGWNEAYEETREQQQQRAAREREQAAARATYQAERETARARAEELLLSLLTDEQAASYTENGWFEVRGSRGGRWRIRRRGQMGNVDLMPEIGEVREASFCCHPPGGLPDADAHVAQMLHLVTDEEGFRRTANLLHGRAA